MSTDTVAGASSSNGTLGRSARPPGQLWQVPMFLTGLVALVLVAAAGPLVPKPVDDTLETDLVTIREALEKPGVPPADIIVLAENAVLHTTQQPELTGLAHYLLGTICLRQAEARSTDHVRESREQAAMHLELAELRGVPHDDRLRLTYLRGKILYMNNGDLLRIIDLLSSSLPAGAVNPAEGYGMLVQAYLRKAVPDLEAALAASGKQIEFTEEEQPLVLARMQRGELLLKLERRGEALKVFDLAAAKAQPKQRLKIRLLQARTAMEEGLWGRAIPWWNELLADASSVPGGKGRIYYNLGLCCLNFDQPAHEKEAVAAWQEALLYGGDDAQAAALRLGELRLYSSTSKSALDFFERALDKVSTPADFKNTLIDVRKARELMEETCRIFNEQQDAESFEKAAELFKKLAPPGAADEKVAQAREARGKEILDKARNAADEGVVREQARTWLHDAALAWEKAAESRTPIDRVDDLWHAVQCYQLANNQVQAIAVLRKFVDLPAPADRKAEAWFTLAEIQRDLKQPLDAQQSYKHCVAFDNPTFSAKALLHLADMALERHELKEAEDALVQVAYPPEGVADHASHEMALLKLANLFFQQHQFEKAAIQCKELVKQAPAHPSILSVREQLGECYRLLASQAESNANSPEPLSAEKKAYYWRERQSNLELARETYQQLSDDLELRGRTKELTPVEETLRRKALFVVADCWYDLPNWFDKAFTCYAKLWESYRLQPDGLWACQRLYRCLVFATSAKLSNVDAVREVTEAAVEVNLRNLQSLEEAGAFRDETEKARWQEWLDSVQSSLRKMKGTS